MLLFKIHTFFFQIWLLSIKWWKMIWTRSCKCESFFCQKYAKTETTVLFQMEIWNRTLVLFFHFCSFCFTSLVCLLHKVNAASNLQGNLTLFQIKLYKVYSLYILYIVCDTQQKYNDSGYTLTYIKLPLVYWLTDNTREASSQSKTFTRSLIKTFCTQ